MHLKKLFKLKLSALVNMTWLITLFAPYNTCVNHLKGKILCYRLYTHDTVADSLNTWFFFEKKRYDLKC